jgi:hypothetical protein
MAGKQRNDKNESEKETEPKEKAGFLGELLDLICRAPFPFSAVGLVLRRLPPPWNKRALAIVLIAVGILIVHPLVPPLRDFSLWLYYRVIPGPSVLVDFNNVTGESASIGKDFKFWISENQNDNRDNAIHDIRAMPDGAITIPPDTQKTVRVRLGRNQKIHRLYRGGGYLRLCLDVDETEEEVENDCSKVISEGFSLVICDPEQWTSPAIALWFSPMGARADPNRYIPEHSEWAMEAIAEKLGAFRVVVDDSLRQENSAQVFVKVAVGCYKTDKPDESELKVSIQNGKIKERDLVAEQYKTAGDIHDIKRALRGRAERIVPRIHERILNAYPLRGCIEDVEEVEDTSLKRVILNIGRDAGVLMGDEFTVWGPSDDTNSIAHVTVKDIEPMYSFAESSDQDGGWRIKKGCRVKKE